MKTIAITELTEIEAIIRKCPYCTVGITDLEGNPYVVPMNFAYRDGIIYLHSGPEGSKVTMEITGWLDTQTAPQLEKELSALDPGTTSLVFDFANLEYISSAGLRLVIAAYKKMAGKEGFRIVNVSDEVYDVFSLTGFDQKINIEKK